MTNKLTILDFYADWCHPCKQMAPFLYELVDTYSFELIKINADVDKRTMEYAVQSLPTLIFIVNGEIKERMVGFQPKKKLEKLIKECLSSE